MEEQVLSISAQRKNIHKIFSQIPQTYALINHILTLGLDVLWRKKAAKHAARSGGTRWLDVCSGTADMAVLLEGLANEKTMIVSVDFCLPMLRKARLRPEAKKIYFCLSNASELPFPDNIFDLVTISFATRNINAGREVLLEYFRQFHRVLKPGGRFIHLETSQPRSNIIRSLFHFYVRLIVIPVGHLISGSRTAYAYLSHSIMLSLKVEELAEILYKAGFKKVNFSCLTFGACAIHRAIK